MTTTKATKSGSKSARAATAPDKPSDREGAPRTESTTKTKTGAKRAKKKAPRKDTAKSRGEGTASAKRSARGSAAEAARILEADDRASQIAEQGERLLDTRSTVATQAARVVSEIMAAEPEAIVPLVDKFVKGITSKHKRVVQTAADGLTTVAGIAPARVARHLDVLKRSFEPATLVGRDGLVRTFAALCNASVAYQRRLEPVLTTALGGADGKTLFAWSQTVLPALKGEPHANARAVVEHRLNRIPRACAQKIADELGIRLRPRYR